jgi:hypothetical protein
VEDDFVELHNPLDVPVALGGLYWTDNPRGWPDRHGMEALSFIGPGEWLAFQADGNTQNGADHLNFSLSYEQGMIALLDPALRVIDQVVYGPQRTDVSEARPDPASDATEFFATATPGRPNTPLPNLFLTASPVNAGGNLIGVRLTFLAEANQSYVIESADRLAPLVWAFFSREPAQPTARVVAVDVPVEGEGRFFRVRLE